MQAQQGPSQGALPLPPWSLPDAMVGWNIKAGLHHLHDAMHVRARKGLDGVAQPLTGVHLVPAIGAGKGAGGGGRRGRPPLLLLQLLLRLVHGVC